MHVRFTLERAKVNPYFDGVSASGFSPEAEDFAAAPTQVNVHLHLRLTPNRCFSKLSSSYVESPVRAAVTP